MPRILRSYLISFVIIGVILTIVHFLDVYLRAKHERENGKRPAIEKIEEMEKMEKAEMPTIPDQSSFLDSPNCSPVAVVAITDRFANRENA